MIETAHDLITINFENFEWGSYLAGTIVGTAAYAFFDLVSFRFSRTGKRP